VSKRDINPIGAIHHRRSSGQRKKQITWKQVIPSLFGFIAAVTILTFLKQAEDGSAAPENTTQKEYFKIFSPDFIYEWMIGAPERPAEYISVVIVGKDSGTAIMNSVESGGKTVSTACERRRYIAHLLNALASFGPRVIVLDVWFDPEFCSEQNSQPLWDALDAVSKRIPVVSGIGSYDLSEVVSTWPAELAAVGRRRSMLEPTELVSMPAINPIRSSSGQIIQAVVELDSDSRKIPLSWPVYRHFAAITDGAKPDRIDSLSIAAVRAFNPQDQILKRVDALDSTNLPVASTSTPPYTSFLREENLPIFRADDIICSSVAVDVSRGNCSTIGATALDLKAVITGKVVLLGLAGFGSDVHKSVIGNVPGVVLHANYVESLLQGRVYLPVPIFFQALIWLVWLGILFAIPWFTSRPHWIVCWLLIAIAVPAYLIHLFISWFKYYTPLVFPVVLATGFLLVSRKIEAALEKHEETK
jgi:CHASE2 domain-containing sensor protein